MRVLRETSRLRRRTRGSRYLILSAAVLVLLGASCGKDSDAAQRPAAMQGRWRGVSGDGKQMLSFGMWGDGRYEWRTASAVDRSPILGHDGTWEAAGAAKPAPDEIDLHCRELHPETVQRIETDETYRIRFSVLPNEAGRMRIESPWGTFVCKHDEGA